jgi:hypothetical protein
MDSVKEMYRMFKKHGFQLAGLRSFGKYVTEADITRKRALATEWSTNPEEFAHMQSEAAARLTELPAMSKGVSASIHRQSAKTLTSAD